MWSKWDLTRAARGLRSANRVVVLQTLRQIHVRLWHAPAKRVKDLLQAAGVPQAVIDEVQSVVDSCRVCREWQRRSDSPVVSLTLTKTFNEGVQFDLLCLDDGVVCARDRLVYPVGAGAVRRVEGTAVCAGGFGPG